MFRSNHNYIQFGIFSQIIHPLLTTCVAPILLLTVLNYKIFLGSSRLPNSSQETNLSTIMIAIVSVFIIMALPKMALNLYEVTTIHDIVECRQRGCGYNISAQRWLADSVVRKISNISNISILRKLAYSKNILRKKENRIRKNDDSFKGTLSSSTLL